MPNQKAVIRILGDASSVKLKAKYDSTKADSGASLSFGIQGQQGGGVECNG